jgi:hypothetical protein
LDCWELGRCSRRSCSAGGAKTVERTIPQNRAMPLARQLRLAGFLLARGKNPQTTLAVMAERRAGNRKKRIYKLPKSAGAEDVIEGFIDLWAQHVPRCYRPRSSILEKRQPSWEREESATAGAVAK